MPTHDELCQFWRATDYRVRLPWGGHASIRVDENLPDALRGLLYRPDDPWGFITAWNPGAQKRAPMRNRQCQHELTGILRREGYPYHAAVGAGTGRRDPWREPSLFVPAIAFERLDTLARQFGQLAVLRGTRDGSARLHELA